MRGFQTGRWSPAVFNRGLAVLLLAVLSWAHPVQASVLRYCSHEGGFVAPGHDCCKSQATASCCGEGTEYPQGTVSIGSPSCVDCCEMFTLREIDLSDALTTSSATDVETALRELSAGPVEILTRTLGSASFPFIEASNSTAGRPLYLLTCRFLI